MGRRSLEEMQEREMTIQHPMRRRRNTTAQSKEHHHKSKAGHAELRKDQEKQIENLDERLRAELLHHVLDKTKDKRIKPLLTEDDLIGKLQSMELIQNQRTLEVP